MSWSRSSRRILTVAVMLTAAIGLLVSHDRLEILQAEYRTESDLLFVPTGKTVRPFLLGQEAFVADLIWIRTLGYVGDQLVARRQLRHLEGLVDLITDLDPRFEQVYIWAGALMMYSGGRISREKILASTRILEKGWKFIQDDSLGWRHRPNYWMIPQMIGFNYAVELRDRSKGAPYIAATARIPGSPDLYKTWAATLYSRSGNLEEGTRLLEDMLAVETLQGQMENAEESEVKRRIRDRLDYYYDRLYGPEGGAERIRMIEERVAGLVREWRQTLPYVPFSFYLLIRSEESGGDTEEIDDLWRRCFPLLSLEVR